MVETVRLNFQGFYKPNLICQSCKISECSQSHLLNCKMLIGSNEIVSYIPEYKDIFNDNDTEEQCYIANIMKENLKKKKVIEEYK